MEPACPLTEESPISTGGSEVQFQAISFHPDLDRIRGYLDEKSTWKRGLASLLHPREYERHAIVFQKNEIETVIHRLSTLEKSNGHYHISLISPFFKDIGLDESGGQLGSHGQFSFFLDPSRKGKRLLITRFLDLAVAVPALTFWIPFHLLAVAAIRLTSRGEAIFRSERIGFKEKEFTVLKYRTMAISSNDSCHREFVSAIYEKQAESIDDPDEVLKLTSDSRITPLGKVIRKLSIDEIPQLWNVLKGEMTLIGPRPCMDYEHEMMESWQRRRFEVTPGLSGMWQVYGRSRCSIQQSHFLDSLFVYAQSTALYIRLVARTPFAVLSMKGAC
ncbi:MAG: sugar transferase [Verrucomicrobiota bacterium]